MEYSNAVGAGHSRSSKGMSSLLARALPEAEISTTTAEISGNVATPASPSTNERGGIDGAQPSGTITIKRSRRESSKSSVPRVSSSLPLPKGDGDRDRARPSSPQSSAHEEPVPREEAVAAASPTSQAPSSAQDTKRRKRRCSSRTMRAEKADECRETDKPATQKIPSGESRDRRSYCSPNATSSATGKSSKDLRENPTVISPTSDGSASRLLADKKRRPGKDHHTTEIVPPPGSKTNALIARPRSSERPREESASPEGRYLGRPKRRTRRRQDESAEGIKAGRRGRDGAEGAVSRRQQRGGPTKKKLLEGKPKEALVEPSPPQALGLEVIDRGAMKQLVISADDTVIAMKGEKGKPKLSSDRSSRTISRRDGSSKGRERKLSHGRRDFPTEAEEEGRRKDSRDSSATVVPAEAEGKRYLADGVPDVLADHEIRPRGTGQQTPPTTRPSHPEETHSKQAQPRHHHCDHRDHSQGFSRQEKAGAVCTASRDSSPRMAPSFSVLQHAEDGDQPRALSPPVELDVPPEIPLPWGSPGDNESSSSTSSSSSFQGRPVPERTAMYVSQQKSFHANISDGFIDLSSPAGGVHGQGGGGRGRGGQAPIGGGAKDDQSCVITVEAGTITSSKSAICGSSSAPTVDDTRSATSSTRRGTQAPNEIQREQIAPPIVSAVRPSPKTTWESKSGCDRQDGGQRDTTGPAQEVEASPSAVPVGEPGPSASMHSVNVHAVSSKKSGGGTSSTLKEAKELEQAATRLLSHVQSKESTRNEKGDSYMPREDLVHFRTDVSRHLVGGERPALFFLRPNESLAVTRIDGSGRLLVTLREEAGAEIVAVDGAIVHDSAAHFGDAAINTGHRFPYVAGHRYEFRVVPAQGVELAVRGNGNGQGKAAPCAPQAKKTPITGLNVSFSVTSAYSTGARLSERDAMQVALPTFEATPPTDFAQHPATLVSSAPTAARKTRPSPCFVAAADEARLSPNARFQGPDSVGDQRSSQVTTEEALVGPCVSRPSVGGGPLATTLSVVEASARRPGDSAPVPIPTAPAINTSDRAHRGNLSSQFATRPAPSEVITGVKGTDKTLTGRLSWNPAWEKQELLPSSSAPRETSRQNHEPALPYIRRHSEVASPRSGFESQESSGYEGNFASRDSVVGADSYARPTGYFGQVAPVQNILREVPSGPEGEANALRYHRPAREQWHNAPSPYYERVVSSPRSSGAGNAAEAVWKQRRHLDKDLTTTTGGGSSWGRRRDYAVGGYRRGEGQTSTDNHEHSGWRGRVMKGQARNDGPELRRRSEQDVSLACGWNGYEHGHHLTTGLRPNADQEPTRYRFHHSSRGGEASHLSGSSRGGFTHGEGHLVSPGESCFEQTKTMRYPCEQPRRAAGAEARWRMPVDRGTKGDALGAKSIGREVHRSRKREGYSGSSDAGKRKPEGGYLGGVNGGEQARNDHDSEQNRSQQHVSSNYHQPRANRHFPHGNREGARIAHEAGFTANAANVADRMPPRWRKF